jgi:L-lactate dehydrogenase (cytochrome)
MTVVRASRAVVRSLSVDDLRRVAQRRLPLPLFEYLDGAAETEYTARRNSAAFDDVALIPRCLVDVSSVRTSTQLLGQAVSWPVLCSPTGASRFYHAEGELAVARATREQGTLYGVSVMGTHPLESVAAASGPKMFQLLAFKDRDLTIDLMERARRAGYPALCLTVDAAVRGKRERELRAGLGMPLKLSWESLGRSLLRPHWAAGQLRAGPMTLANLATWSKRSGLIAQSEYAGSQLDTTVTWQEARSLIDRWKGPFAIKGVLSDTDARQAVDAGATAIIVSNHGGRQLDGASSSIEALPAIVSAVGDRAEVILDGGIRRGSHILKALALGAKGCSIGRPYLYGLAAGGECGVLRVLAILKDELIRAMQLTGCTDVTQIGQGFVRWR